MGHSLPQLTAQQHQLPCCHRSSTLPQTRQSRSRTPHTCQARHAGAIAETLSPISLSQTQESVQVLKRTRLITAIKTPYREDGKFDLRAYDAHVESQIAHGVEGLIVGGTTGTVFSKKCDSKQDERLCSYVIWSAAPCKLCV